MAAFGCIEKCNVEDGGILLKTLIAGDVYSLLRRRVASGKLTSGTRISELALSKELGVSRGPVREAVMRLTGEGLLEHVNSAGTFVKEMTRKDIQEIYQLRIWIEGEAAAEAAGQITEREIAELQKCCEELQVFDTSPVTSESISRIVVADFSFHAALMKASRNLRAVKLLADQHLLSSLIGRAEGSWEATSLKLVCEEHFAISLAVQNKDTALARQLMRNHLSAGLDNALDICDRKVAASTALENFGVEPEVLTKTLRNLEDQQLRDQK